MMSPKSERTLRKMTVRFYDDNLKLLREAYPGTGYNEIIRALTDKHCRKLRSATAELLKEEKLSDEELASL